MELISSSINETWKFRAFWCLVGCFITLLFLNQNQQKVDFSLLLGQFHPQLVANSILNPISEPADQSIPLDHPADQSPSLDHHVVTSTPISHTEIQKNVNTDPPRDEKPVLVNETTTTTQSSCNIFEGRWVYNAENEPSYNSTRCPFVEEKFSCQKNGRPDSDYEKWRWEANDCDIPLFDGKDMLERLRDKRVIIVGDSLNRNQWESLACLLYSSISNSSRAEVSADGPTYKFIKAKDYNCTVEFYWSPFLVNFNDSHESGRKVLVLDKLLPTYPRWLGADVMVFNSGHWWTHTGKLRSWDVFEYKGKLIEEMPIEVAYKRAMKTWAKWVRTNVDPTKTKVFFRSISAAHHGKTWCYNNTQPISSDDYSSYESHFPKALSNAIKGLIEESSLSKLGVKYLNITKLSEYRRDAHPSMYRNTQWKDGTFQTAFADCSHWCLPGLPDTWNRLLYASLFYHNN